MYTGKIVRQIMESQNISNAQLGKRLGCSNATIFERLKYNNIGLKNLVDMLAVLDYQLVIQPNTSKLQSGEYRVEVADRELDKEIKKGINTLKKDTAE